MYKKLLRDNAYSILLIAYMIYTCIGIFPLYCYESDSMHTIMGMATLYNQGFTVPPIYSYEYAMQPLAYYLIASFRHILPFFTCEELFCLLTGIAGLALVPLTVSLIYRITNINKIIILFSIFMIPESMAISMYPNTAVFALLSTVIGLNLIIFGHRISAIFALAIAPLFRVDILLIYPVVLFIYLWLDNNFIRSLKKSITLGICVMTLTILGFILLDANPLTSTLEKFGSYNQSIEASKIFYAIFSFYTVANFILLPLGIYIVIKKHQFRLLLLAITPIILNHFVYRSMGCATKHFLYMLPFVAIFTSIAIRKIITWSSQNNLIKVSVITSTILFLICSVRINYPGKTWLNSDVSETHIGPNLPLFKENFSKYKISIGLGAGALIHTLDEQMLLTGNAFYPLYIHNLKTKAKKLRDQALNHLKGRSFNLWGSGWETYANLPLVFLDDGFYLNSVNDEYVLTKGNQKIRLILTNETPLGSDEASRYKRMTDAINMIKQEVDSIYVYSSYGSETYFFDRQVQFGSITKVPDTETLYFIKN